MKTKLIILLILLATGQSYGATRSVTAFPVIVPADNDYFILTDTSNSGLFGKTTVANIKNLFAAPLGADDNYVTGAEKTRIGDLEATDDVSFASVTATGSGGLVSGVQSTTQGGLTLYSNVNAFVTGILPAATPTGTWSLRLPPAAPGGAKYLFSVDADGTGGWTDPATLGGDDLGSAAASDVVALFASGSCSGYLKSDGTCDSPTGTGDMVLADVQSVTGLKTFDSVKLAVKGASTGYTLFENTNAGATNYTLTLPNANGTLARLSDIPASATGLAFTPDGSIASSNVQDAIEEVRDEATGLASLPTADNQILQATGSGTYEWTSTLDGIGDITGAGSYNNITVTQPATGATLTLADGSSFITSGGHSLTLTTTAATDVTLPTSGTLATTIASEVNGSADDTLSAAEVSSTIVYNTGMGAADVALTLPTAAAGYSAIFTVGTAQSNKWGVRAGTNDKIYLLAADGTVSAGSDNGYARMTAAQIGQSFACWTFKTDAYDWMCKAVSIGTSTFAAN